MSGRVIFAAFLGREAQKCFRKNSDSPILRYWYEVNQSSSDWDTHHKGGQYRKWYGNIEYVIFWKSDGVSIKNQPNSGIQGSPTFSENGFIWSDITSGGFSARLKPKGDKFDSASPAGYPTTNISNEEILLFLNSSIVSYLTPILNPTLHFKVGNTRALPLVQKIESTTAINRCSRCIEIAKTDWNTYETSWDFQSNPLIVGWVSVA